MIGQRWPKPTGNASPLPGEPCREVGLLITTGAQNWTLHGRNAPGLGGLSRFEPCPDRDGAADQLQLDIYGEAIDSIYRADLSMVTLSPVRARWKGHAIRRKMLTYAKSPGALYSEGIAATGKQSGKVPRRSATWIEAARSLNPALNARGTRRRARPSPLRPIRRCSTGQPPAMMRAFCAWNSASVRTPADLSSPSC